MSSPLCPGTATTLRSRSIELMEADLAAPRNLDAMPLDELKLEVDARVAPLLAVIALHALTPNTEQYCADYVRTRVVDTSQVLPTFVRHHGVVTWNLFKICLDSMSDSETGKRHLADIDHYREAYYVRSPAAADTERHYESIDALMGSGLNTASDHIPLIVTQLNTLGICNNLSIQERIELTKNSGHLVLYLSKLKLYKLENYVDYINDNPEADFTMFNLVIKEGKAVACFNPQFLAAVKKATKPEPKNQEHRPKIGCSAAVALTGEDETVLGKLWDWSVGALEKSGLWEEIAVHEQKS